MGDGSRHAKATPSVTIDLALEWWHQERWYGVDKPESSPSRERPANYGPMEGVSCCQCMRHNSGHPHHQSLDKVGSRNSRICSTLHLQSLTVPLRIACQCHSTSGRDDFCWPMDCSRLNRNNVDWNAEAGRNVTSRSNNAKEDLRYSKRPSWPLRCFISESKPPSLHGINDLTS